MNPVELLKKKQICIPLEGSDLFFPNIIMDCSSRVMESVTKLPNLIYYFLFGVVTFNAFFVKMYFFFVAL